VLKRIAVSELRIGMYIDELCGSWMEHPFWRTRFALKDALDVRRIAESGIQEVWIDTDKGSMPMRRRRTADPGRRRSRDRAQAAALGLGGSRPGGRSRGVPDELERAHVVYARARPAC